MGSDRESVAVILLLDGPTGARSTEYTDPTPYATDHSREYVASISPH